MILLSVAVIAVGLFVLPQTMAMFIGQHTWFSVRTGESQYEMCAKCHVNEVAEWELNAVNGGAHSRYEAEFGTGCFCHQINTTALALYKVNLTAINASGYNYTHWCDIADLDNSSDWKWRPTDTAHAAVIIDCIDCHWNESQQLQNKASAHYEFWNQTKGGVGIGDNNTACMACHTHTHLNITWIRREGLIITANHTDVAAAANESWVLNVTIDPELHKSRAIYNDTGDAAYYVWNNDTQTWELYTKYSVTISTPAGKSASNGTSVYYPLVVKNTGTVADTYTMSINLIGTPPDTYALDPSVGTPVDIAPGATDGVVLEIMDATTGTYNVTVTVTSLNATTTTTATTGAIMTTFSPSP